MPCVSIDEAKGVAAPNEIPVLALDWALARLEEVDGSWRQSWSFVRLAASRSRKRHRFSMCRLRPPTRLAHRKSLAQS